VITQNCDFCTNFSGKVESSTKGPRKFSATHNFPARSIPYNWPVFGKADTTYKRLRAVKLKMMQVSKTEI
jgi:hypothetical protein